MVEQIETQVEERPESRNAQSNGPKTNWQKVAKAKVYITLNKAHNSKRDWDWEWEWKDLGAALMSVNGQWRTKRQ